MDENSRRDPRHSSGKGNRDAVKFECPNCKAAVHIGISRLRVGSKVDCAACKTEHSLTAEEVPRLLAQHRKRLGTLKPG